MKIKLSLIAILLITSALFDGCKKEGPIGPAGKDGNANVKSSTITFSNWIYDGTAGIQYDYVDFTWSEITSSIVNTGGVFIYLSNGSGGWVPLPRSIFPTSTYTQSQRFIYNVGTFRIIVQDSDLTQPASPGQWTIKILALSSSARKANPNLDWSNYNAVKAQFNLPN